MHPGLSSLHSYPDLKAGSQPRELGMYISLVGGGEPEAEAVAAWLTPSRA